MNMSETLDFTKPYRGVVVPMVTPITSDGNLDEQAVRRVIDHLIEGGVDGVFVLGTTGEAASVPRPMQSRLVAVTVEHVDDRAVTYAGVGDNCLAHSVQAAEEYFRLGIDVVVAHLPCYYSLGPEEQGDYYTVLANRIPGPMMMYNIPSTTHMSIPIKVVEKMSCHPKIVGLKDSENGVARLEAMAEALRGRSDFAFFVGVSALSAKALSLGVDGMVPSPGQLVPDLCRRLYESGVQGDAAGANEYQRQINQVNAIYTRNRTLGQSLAALKAAMGALGLCNPNVLPPLRRLNPVQQEAVRRKFLEWQAKRNTV
jgi:4-hydroxy-tetrahydrodipicolinate synthase